MNGRTAASSYNTKMLRAVELTFISLGPITSMGPFRFCVAFYTYPKSSSLEFSAVF